MKEQLLSETLRAYSMRNYPFHMPGHKFGRHLKLNDIHQIDVTEVKGTDNLHHPKTIIKEAQEKAADLFGADKTYFLVNGSTGGILSTISAVCHPGDSILIARNCHRAVYNAIIIHQLKPIYCYPEINPNTGIAGGISSNQIETILKDNDSIKMMVITSPTYEGIVSDIEQIAKIVHHNNVILFVDEAHGSHFKFHPRFPKTALEMGADIVIQSTHKTLPAYTQSAMLHIKSSKINWYEISQQLSIYQSSSPSYILLSGLDHCCHLLKQHGRELFHSYFNLLMKYRQVLAENLSCLKLLNDDCIGRMAVYDIDISKIVLICTNANMNGIVLDNKLREMYQIQVELSSLNHMIALTSVSDTSLGIEKLTKALLHIDDELHLKHNTKPFFMVPLESKYLPSEALQKDKKLVHLKDSIGQAVGEFVIPFPPGIPLIVPGEIVTKEMTRIIRKSIKQGISILGMKDTSGEMIQIIEG